MESPPTTGPWAAPPPPPSPPFGSPRPRELRRRPDEGPIAGVCAGVAEYFDVDPVIVRIAAVVLAITGPGVIAYVLAWIFVPAASGDSLRPIQHPPTDRRDRGAQVFGIVLLAIAVSVLWGDWWSPARRWMFPLGLMALGTWLLLRRDPATGGGDQGVPPPAPSPPPAPWAAPAPPTATTRPADHEPGDETGSTEPDGTTSDAPGAADDEPGGGDATTVGLVVDPTAGGGDAGGGAGGGAGPPTATWSYQPPPRPPEVPELNGTARRRRRMLAPMVMGALLIWGGVAWLSGVSVESALAVGLCIVGLGFVLGAFVGGSWGLIVPAVVIAGALIVASIADIPLSGPIGDRTWVPTDADDVASQYEVSIGEAQLDLTEVAVPAGDVLSVDASVGIGHLVILVPEDVAVDVTADVAAGEAVLLGLSDSGTNVSTHRAFERRGAAGTIELDLQVGLGQIEVRRQVAETPTLRPTTPTTFGAGA
jgi:phage shock protein PspC (stress-responsive transcriptional regulator)